MLNLAARLYKGRGNHNFQAYLESRQRIRYAPYPLYIYRDLLTKAMQSDHVRFLPFLENQTGGSARANFYLRHDIDTAACIHNMRVILEVDRSLGVRAGVYLRVDDDEYTLAEHRDVIQDYHKAGFEVGLHTLCYLQDDYLNAFKHETEKFRADTGVQPKSFTVHGLGQHRLDWRLRFSEEIVGRLGEFGYTFSDCHPSLRSYEYVIEDCHWDEDKQSRYIYDDFIKLPIFLRKGTSYLILTHPCYWQT